MEWMLLSSQLCTQFMHSWLTRLTNRTLHECLELRHFSSHVELEIFSSTRSMGPLVKYVMNT